MNCSRNCYDQPYTRKWRKSLWALHQRSRQRKWALFCNLMMPGATDRVIDVGCGAGEFLGRYPFTALVVGIDLNREVLSNTHKRHPDARFVVADGRALPFITGAFDIAFSNAVIEHVGDLAEQKRFGAQVARAATRYFVTTPNKYFPLEVHYRVPFFQFFPRWLQ